MNAQLFSVLGAIGVFTAILVGVFTIRQSIREGKQAQVDHDKAIRDEGFTAGVASVQPQLYDLKNQVASITEGRNREVAQLTDDRNYWRGMNGGGRDQRRDTDDKR